MPHIAVSENQIPEWGSTDLPICSIHWYLGPTEISSFGTDLVPLVNLLQINPIY